MSNEQLNEWIDDIKFGNPDLGDDTEENLKGCVQKLLKRGIDFETASETISDAYYAGVNEYGG